jgi:hypothetical protein
MKLAEKILKMVESDLTKGVVFGNALTKEDAEYIADNMNKKWGNDKGFKFKASVSKTSKQSENYGIKVVLEFPKDDVSNQALQAKSRIKKEITQEVNNIIKKYQ